MDARQIIFDALFDAHYDASVSTRTERVIEALHAAGIDLVHRDENHGPTLERAAKVIAAMVWYKNASDAHLIANGPEDYAAAIRAMKVKHNG